MIHGSMTAAIAQIEKALSDARYAGKFMVAVWHPSEDGKDLICKRTTWEFPVERFAEAIEQLNRMLEEERHPPRSPLPLASFLQRGPLNGGADSDRQIEVDQREMGLRFDGGALCDE